MGEKETRLVEAAIEVFSRYGVRRTTMGDIAAQAGISRQTLYATYSGKDQILNAALCHISRLTLDKIRTDWAERQTIADKLDVYFNHAVIAFFEQIRSMPDSRDLMGGASDGIAINYAEAEEPKKQALADQFLPYAKRLSGAGMSSRDLADFILQSTQSFKIVAIDEAHLRRLLKTLKGSVLALIGEHQCDV